MNILFIEKRIRADKLGICILSRILKTAGHNVDMIQDDIDSAEEYLSKNKVDFIMFSVSSGDQDWVFEINRKLKNKFQIKTVVGGPHFTFFPEQGNDDPDIDFVVRGPGDTVIVDIVEGKITEKVIKAPLIDLDCAELPDRSIIYKYDEFGKADMKRFMFNRYCPHACSYCFNHHYKQLYKEQRDNFKQLYPIDKIIAEIKDVKETYGLKLAYFNDDNLAFNHEWLNELLAELKKLNINFCGSVRADNVTEEILKNMADAGCTFLNMALEAGSETSLKLLRRGKATFECVKTAAQWAMKHGIKIRIQNMIGLPVSNPLEDAFITLKCNLEIGPTDSWCSVYQPYGGTDLAKYCSDNNFMQNNCVAQSQYSRSQLNIPDQEKLYILSKWWWYIIVHNLDLDFVHTLLEIPMTDEQFDILQNIRLEKSKNLLYGI